MRPEAAIRTWRAVAAALGVAALLVGGLSLLTYGYGRDQALYAVIGHGLLDGRVPYRDLWDLKPPGIFAVYALAAGLFGRGYEAVRVLELLALGAQAVALARMTRVALGSHAPGLLAGGLAAFLHAQFEYWHTAQPEGFAAALAALALAVAVEATPGSRARAAAAIGLLGGLLALLKPHLAGGALVPLAWLLLAGGRPTPRTLLGLLGAAALGAAAPLLACGAWFAAHGALPDLAWTFGQYVPGHVALTAGPGLGAGLLRVGGDLLLRLSPLVPAGLLAAALARSAAHRPLLAAAGAGLLVQALGVAVQGKFFAYHHLAALPWLALVVALGLDGLALRLVRWRPAAVALPLALLLAGLATTRVWLVGPDWRARLPLRAAHLPELLARDPARSPATVLSANDEYDLVEVEQAAALIAANTEPGDRIFVWGYEPGLYLRSGRTPASRWLYDVPLRAPHGSAHSRPVLLAELLAAPPAVIVVQHGNRVDNIVGDDRDPAEALAGFPELQAMLEARYPIAARVGDLELRALR